MTDTEDPRLAQARDLLAPYGDAISAAQLAPLLTYRRSGPVRALIEAGEFPAIALGHGRYSIPTKTLIPWLASRLTPAPKEDQ